MRTKLISLTHPRTPLAMEELSRAFGCVVHSYHRNPHELILPREVTREQLCFIIPRGLPYRIEYLHDGTVAAQRKTAPA